ncbi:MAG: hypothetical protein PHW69_00215 [Elusimicrobiaceae bacterium]|nr:hypothetical protein [Elusimicrobiaceae bacterium]
MENYVGIVGIIIHNRETAAPQVNEVLTRHGNLIAGRMGMPYHGKKMHVITLIVDGKDSDICRMTGELEAIKDVIIKTSTAKCNL